MHRRKILKNQKRGSWPQFKSSLVCVCVCVCVFMCVCVCWPFLAHFLSTFLSPHVHLWGFFNVLLLLLRPKQRRRNFPETDGGWRSPNLIRTELCALHPPVPPHFDHHPLVHMSLNPLEVCCKPGQIPQAINPQKRTISWVRAFSAWLGAAEVKPRKPWQCGTEDCSGHSAYDNQRDAKLGLHRLQRGKAYAETPVEKSTETNYLWYRIMTLRGNESTNAAATN